MDSLSLLDELEEKLKIAMKALRGAEDELNRAVSAERERCVKVALQSIDFQNLDGDRLYRNGARWAAGFIAANIRSGK
jgi:hypothetical protein